MNKLIAQASRICVDRTVAKTISMLGMVSGLLAVSGMGISGTISTAPGVVTNLAELVELVSADEIRVVPLQLGGTVWWSSEAEGRVILHDDTATVQLELDLPCSMPSWINAWAMVVIARSPSAPWRSNAVCNSSRLTRSVALLK